MNDLQLDKQISSFLAADVFAVVGASVDRHKYGNKVLRMYLQHGYNVVPVNPNARSVEGLSAVASLGDIISPPDAVSIITPPHVTEKIVQEAVELGIKNVWMQPGAESDKAIRVCREAGINLLHSGPCILVVVGFHDV